jgi:hypothetical protein
MTFGTLYGNVSESNGLYGIGQVIPGSTYFEWFIFKESVGQPATPTGGSWNFDTNIGVPPTGWSSTSPNIPVNPVWFCIAFVDSRNPTVIVWSAASKITAGSAAAAVDISFSPTGTIASTNVQSAIAEVVTDLSASSGSSLVGYTQGSAGAVATTVQTNLRQVVSVKDFGAVGDGSTNDTSKFTTVEALSEAFIYLPTGTYVVNGINLKKTYFGPGIIKLNGTNRPQTLSNARPDQVKVFPPVSNASNVLLPGGTWLDVSASTTSGLQEAITYACGNGTAGTASLDLYIVGAEQSTGGAVVYNCTTALQFPAMQGRKIRSGACTINFTSAIGSGTCVTFDSAIMLDVDLSGCQIVNGGTGRALSFSPVNGVPLDGGLFGVKALIDCRFHITTVVNINNSTAASANGAVVTFNPAAGGTGINNCTFSFEEINQQNSAANTYGIWVVNSTSSAPFANNFIKCVHVHNHKGGGVQIGSSTGIAGYSNNTWEISCSAGTGATTDFNTYGSYDTLFISNDNTNAQYGLKLQTNAQANSILGGTLLGSIAAYDNSATNKTSNAWYKAQAIAAPTTISVSASPFVYQNTTLSDMLVLVNSGTLTANTFLSVDGSSYYDTGATTGSFYLPHGMYMKVTYSAAPTMRQFTF